MVTPTTEASFGKEEYDTSVLEREGGTLQPLSCCNVPPSLSKRGLMLLCRFGDYFWLKLEKVSVQWKSTHVRGD